MLRLQILAPLYLSLIFAFTGCRSTPPTLSTGRASRSPAKSPDPCAEAARHYELGDISDAEIVKQFQQLADQGDPRGTMWMARLYSKGRSSLPKRPEFAQQMATNVVAKVAKLAARNDAEAQFLLGSAYQEELGVQRDLKKAVTWYTKAVKAGQITAMNNLGVMLAYGHGHKPDINKARELFSRAAIAGSKLAQKNSADFADDGRDDQSRLQALRSVPLVQALGLQKDAGIAFLAKKGLISDPKNFVESVYKDQNRFHFPADGIVLNTDVSGRIKNVEGHAKGSPHSEQFKGELPLGVTWNMTVDSATQMLGRPDDRGTVENDEAYGIAYRVENLFFAVMFTYDGERQVKLWRVHEKWAAKY
jgi:TPR repeat protein